MHPLGDDIIADIIPIKIDADMSVSTLYALETIFYLRLLLAQASEEENEPIYERLRRDRFGQLSNALMKKYPYAESLNEKIEILERLEVISLTIDRDHSDFAISEAMDIEEEANLTYAQKLRLKWLPGIESQDVSENVAELMRSIPKNKSSFVTPDSIFTMATIDLIIDYITDEERKAVIDCYEDMIDAAIASGDTTALSRLLPISAYWNSDITECQRLAGIAAKASTVEGIPLPERRVNTISAEIFTRIEVINSLAYAI